MSQTTERYADTYGLAVTGLYAGKGSGCAPWNPTRIVECFKQLERWTRLSLLHRKTRLHCFNCHTVQTVTDAYNHTAALACGCKRPVHTMTDSDYVNLVERAKGLQVTGRNARVGGYELVKVKEV